MTTTQITTTAWWWTGQQPYNVNFDGIVLFNTVTWMIFLMILIAPILLVMFSVYMIDNQNRH